MLLAVWILVGPTFFDSQIQYAGKFVKLQNWQFVGWSRAGVSDSANLDSTSGVHRFFVTWVLIGDIFGQACLAFLGKLRPQMFGLSRAKLLRRNGAV